MKQLILIFIMSFSLQNCADNGELPLQSMNVEFTEIGKGSFSGDGAEGINKQNIIITNEEDWNNLKLQMNTVDMYTDFFNETEIDFSKFMIIASFSEIKNQGENSTEISKIVKNLKNITVDILQVGSSDTNAITMTSQPFVIVKITKTNLPIVFKETYKNE